MGKILVTGGTGFVGSAIARHYLKLGHEVLITGTRTEQVVPGVKLLECSFTGIDWRYTKDIDLVFHQSANNDTTCLDKDEMTRANYTAPIELFTKLYHHGCRRFVYASSTAVYGNGKVPYTESQYVDTLTPYATSKWLFEGWASAFADQHQDIETCVGLRYCNVYGPGESHKGKRASMIYQLICKMMSGDPKLFTDGEQKRDWIYIEDVVRMNVMASEYKGCDIFNCGTGKSVSFKRLVELINDAMGTCRDIKWIDNPYPHLYQSHTECSTDKAKQLLNFEPTFAIQDGIREYVKHMKSLDSGLRSDAP